MYQKENVMLVNSGYSSQNWLLISKVVKIKGPVICLQSGYSPMSNLEQSVSKAKLQKTCYRRKTIFTPGTKDECRWATTVTTAGIFVCMYVCMYIDWCALWLAHPVSLVYFLVLKCSEGNGIMIATNKQALCVCVGGQKRRRRRKLLLLQRFYGTIKQKHLVWKTWYTRKVADAKTEQKPQQKQWRRIIKKNSQKLGKTF